MTYQEISDYLDLCDQFDEVFEDIDSATEEYHEQAFIDDETAIQIKSLIKRMMERHADKS